jgi:hypothetical protein
VLSVFADRDDWAYNDYVKVFRDLQGTAERARRLQGEVDVLRKIASEMQTELTDLKLREAEQLKAQLQRKGSRRSAGWRRWLK